MNIIISGYGRMGHEIEKIALRDHHSVVAIMDTTSDWDNLVIGQYDHPVIIDFSQPDVVLRNIRRAFELKIPMVIGTTGWEDAREAIRKECIESKASVLFASNFSMGMNLFFLLNKTLAHLTKNFTAYTPEIIETHHIHKLDKPSGTAIHLAEQIVNIQAPFSGWSLDHHEEGKINIRSKREGEIPGTHEIIYSGSADQIEIIHKAKNRSGFAEGAIKAALWIEDRTGYFEMEDMLKEELKQSINLF